MYAVHAAPHGCLSAGREPSTSASAPTCPGVRCSENRCSSSRPRPKPCRPQAKRLTTGLSSGSYRYHQQYLADAKNWDRGYPRRRPKAKYASGAPPKELMNTTTGTHIHFEPRIWLAGRRLMSMSAAVLRLPSATAAIVISRRLRLLRSL